jgi:hypothetical protein
MGRTLRYRLARIVRALNTGLSCGIVGAICGWLGGHLAVSTGHPLWFFLIAVPGLGTVICQRIFGECPLTILHRQLLNRG